MHNFHRQCVNSITGIMLQQQVNSSLFVQQTSPAEHYLTLKSNTTVKIQFAFEIAAAHVKQNSANAATEDNIIIVCGRCTQANVVNLLYI